MRAAKARGSQIGPRKGYFDKEIATHLRDLGWGQIKIARELGVGVGRVNEWVRVEYIPPENGYNPGMQSIEDAATDRAD